MRKIINLLMNSSRTQHSLPNSTTISVVKFGAKTHAYNAPTDTSSIKMESAAKFKVHANNSIPKKEFARNAMKVTQWSTANALKSIKAPHKMLAVPNGKTEFAPNAQRDGTSMLIMSVSKLVTSAQFGTNQLVPALNAIMDQLLLKANVFPTKTNSLMPFLTIFSAKLGAKIHALSALTELSSTIRVFALQSVPNATHSTRLQENA